MNQDVPSLLGASIRPDQFRQRRRQKFLTQKFYQLNQQWLRESIDFQIDALRERLRAGDLDPFGQQGVHKDLMNRTLLSYTAGEPLVDASRYFDESFSWFCKWHLDSVRYPQFLATKHGRDLDSTVSPIDPGDLEAFQSLLQVMSLAVLFGNPTALTSIVDLVRFSCGEDMLLNALIAPTGRCTAQVTEFFHAVPYDPLVDAFYTATQAREKVAFVERYLNEWYPAFRDCSWHEGHLLKQDYMTPYYGYWSFEAAAICVIHDIDDSSFRDHLVYPKDLADWARANDSVGRLRAYAEAHAADAEPRLRCQGGQPCPQAGIWHTPADPAATRAFNAGETMPELRTDYGVTIWQLGRA